MHPKLIIINGRVGSGKSTLAINLSKKLPEKNFYLEIDKLKGMFAHYHDDKSANLQIIYDIAAGIIERCLKNNLTVIVDKAMEGSEVEPYEQIAAHYQVKTLKVYLDLDFDTQIQRINKRHILRKEEVMTYQEVHDLKNEFVEDIPQGFEIINTVQITEHEVLDKVFKLIIAT